MSREAGPRDWLWSALFRPIDSAWLVFFRVAFGLLMVRKEYEFLWGRTAVEWSERSFLFTFPGFGWIEQWSQQGLDLHFAVLMLLGFFIAAGFLYRLSCVLHGIGFTYIFLLDQTWYINHYYLICLLSFLMALVPAHHSLSVDAWLRPRLQSAVVPNWSLWVLRLQMGIVYFYGGIAKMNADWVQGWPLRCWLPGSVPFPWVGELWNQEWFAIFLSWGGLLLDTFVFPALLWKKTRPFALLACLGFHFTNSQMFTIGVFPLMATALTLNFLEPDWPRRIFNWPVSALAPAREKRFAWTPQRRVLMGFLGVYFAVQMLVPLRHFLYPGQASWTEEGHLFAWHMKLRSKKGFAIFHLTDPETDEQWFVDPTDELTAFQAQHMATWPHLLHTYTHHLADLVEEEGRPRPQVRAVTGVRFNCRTERPIVDPTLDLAAVPLTLFGRNEWILPLHGNPFEEHPAWRALTDTLAERFPEAQRRGFSNVD